MAEIVCELSSYSADVVAVTETGPITWVPSRVFVPRSAIQVFVTTDTWLPSEGIRPDRRGVVGQLRAELDLELLAAQREPLPGCRAWPEPTP